MNYQVRHRLGRGGMGVVDLAVDDDGRPVALKRLALHGSAREMSQARQRVRREAHALAMLDHPAIVRLLDVIDDGDDVVLVMPYLGGGTLADHVRTRGPLQPAQVTLLATRLLEALGTAHRLGIVHRDIKPGNVLFDEQGRAFLTDFGVASFRDATSGLTLTGSVIGTPDYMAPEQARGERATPASDLFSLGATLLFAATGQPPYGHTDPRVTIERAARGRLAGFPPSLDPGLRRTISPMLRRDPRRRPTAAELVGGPAGTAVMTSRPRRSTGRGRLAVGLAAAAAGVAVIAGVAAYAATHVEVQVGADAAAGPTTTAATCTPRPYQPCGGPAAPNTDGDACLEGFDDYDADLRNGCEAEPDAVDGTLLEQELTANLVPRADVDEYVTDVDDHFHLTCDGTLELTLDAPEGTTMRLEVLRDGELLDQAVSKKGKAASITLFEPSCWEDDSGQLVARVSYDGEARNAAPYELSRTGSF